jgi:predicted membrane metal-binding protein
MFARALFTTTETLSILAPLTSVNSKFAVAPKATAVTFLVSATFGSVVVVVVAFVDAIVVVVCDAPLLALCIVVVVVVAADGKLTVVENAFVLLPNWKVIVPELLALTVQDKDVEEPELISMFAEVWSPEHVPTDVQFNK